MPSRAGMRLLFVTSFAAATATTLVAVRPALASATLADGDHLALAVAWAVAIATSAWLTATGVACVLALRAGRPQLARRIARRTPAGFRRLVEIAVIGSCIGVPAFPAWAHSAPRPVAVAPDIPVVRAPISTSRPAPTSISTAAPRPAATAYIVRPGDNLWRIAGERITATHRDAPTDREIAPYWIAVIAANRATLRSGNPSLIFPGEIVTLPPIPPIP